MISKKWTGVQYVPLVNAVMEISSDPVLTQCSLVICLTPS